MSRAVLKFVRLSPIKARLIARQIQGLDAEFVLASLGYMNNKAAKIISSVLLSAIANGSYDPEEVIVSSCRVDRGPVLKRIKPRAKGRADKLRKPMSHIMVEVTQKSKKLKADNKQGLTKKGLKEIKKVSNSSQKLGFKNRDKL